MTCRFILKPTIQNIGEDVSLNRRFKLESCLIWVLSCPRDKCKDVDRLLARFGAANNWLAQPASPSTYQLRLELQVPVGLSSDLASELSSEGVICELEVLGVEPARYLIHPRLGIHRQIIDASGEPVLRFGQINSFLLRSQGNLSEFGRLIRMAEGQAWLDVFEPLRVIPEDVRILPRAV